MNGFFGERKVRNLTDAVITLILGLLLLLVPSTMLSLLVKVLGWIMVIVGVLFAASGIYNGVKMGWTGTDNIGNTILGVGLILFGTWIKRHPGNVISMVATVVGIIMLLHAINGLRYAVAAYKVNAQGWWSAAISGGLTLILAIVVLLNPFGTTASLVRVGGICLLVDGLSSLFMSYEMKDFF